MKGRKTGGRQKGSLNRVAADVRALAKEYTGLAVSALAEIIADKKMPPAARICACAVMLDRGHGRPASGPLVEINHPI
jgi:hypothetical protein